jgi:hypothetical protein
MTAAVRAEVEPEDCLSVQFSVEHEGEKQE